MTVNDTNTTMIAANKRIFKHALLTSVLMQLIACSDIYAQNRQKDEQPARELSMYLLSEEELMNRYPLSVSEGADKRATKMLAIDRPGPEFLHQVPLSQGWFNMGSFAVNGNDASWGQLLLETIMPDRLVEKGLFDPAVQEQLYYRPAFAPGGQSKDLKLSLPFGQ